MDTTWVQHLRSKFAEAHLLLGICSDQFTCFVSVNGIPYVVSLCLFLYFICDDRCIDRSLLSRLDSVVLAEAYIVTGLISLVNWLRPRILPDPRFVTVARMIAVYGPWMIERRMVCAALCAVTQDSSMACKPCPVKSGPYLTRLFWF
ncbi:hypothetical protein BDQ94DRAFT_164582 [Aspergillus welwitschiae]|uniref:Uncharacterized protein n=1 Tax=Aspergillus welwitschiae TaxID=1341132 RepID=A0A3F3PHA5_9EURO|nr:hypothetical protein BDQ94DRAFT_164582 [Aspergillus welwitschiae]RDH26320.1 hypothetical protein BDQ94DRAFT_164582 [Aspergillus welwitschiae]